MVSLFPQTLTVLWWQQLDIICYFVQVVYFRYVIEGCLCMYIPTQQLNCLFDQDRVCRLLYLLHLNPKRTQITLSRQSFGRISHCLYETIITIINSMPNSYLFIFQINISLKCIATLCIFFDFLNLAAYNPTFVLWWQDLGHILDLTSNVLYKIDLFNLKNLYYWQEQ